MTQIDIHANFIIFVSVAPPQKQGKADTESKTYSRKVHGRLVPEVPRLDSSTKAHCAVLPEATSLGLTSSRKVHFGHVPEAPNQAPSRKVHDGVLPEAPNLAPSRKVHGGVLPEALSLASVMSSSTHSIESDEESEDDDMLFSLLDDDKGK